MGNRLLVPLKKKDCRLKKQAQNYVWKKYQLCFRDMMVPKPNGRKDIIVEMHMEIGHFGKQ